MCKSRERWALALRHLFTYFCSSVGRCLSFLLLLSPSWADLHIKRKNIDSLLMTSFLLRHSATTTTTIILQPQCCEKREATAIAKSVSLENWIEQGGKTCHKIISHFLHYIYLHLLQRISRTIDRPTDILLTMLYTFNSISDHCDFYYVWLFAADAIILYQNNVHICDRSNSVALYHHQKRFTSNRMPINRDRPTTASARKEMISRRSRKFITIIIAAEDKITVHLRQRPFSSEKTDTEYLSFCSIHGRSSIYMRYCARSPISTYIFTFIYLILI